MPRTGGSGGNQGVKAKYNSSNVLEFLDTSGNVIYSVDPANRKMTFPTGSTLAMSGTQEFDDIIGGDSSLAITGQAPATSSSAGGAVVTAGGIGGSSSGAGGLVSMTGGVGTTNAVGGAASLVGGAGAGTGERGDGDWVCVHQRRPKGALVASTGTWLVTWRIGRAQGSPYFAESGRCSVVRTRRIGEGVAHPLDSRFRCGLYSFRRTRL